MDLRRFSNSVRAFVASAVLPAMVLSGVFSATPARAQMATVESGALTATVVTTEVRKNFTDILTTTAVTALVNASNYFASQLAYSAAVALTTDCPGQAVCWDSKSFNDGFKQGWQGAVGEGVGTLSQGILGNNRLCSPGLNFQINLQLGLLNELKPPTPKCSFDTIKNSWGQLISSVESGQVFEQLVPTFSVGNSPTAIALDVLDGMTGVRSQARLDYVVAQLRASGGAGFSGIIDPVSKRIKSPAAVVAAEFDTLTKAKSEDGKRATESANAGAIAARAPATIALNAAQTFGQTLISRLWNKLANGLLSTEELKAGQPDLIIDPEAVLSPGTTSVRTALQTRFVTAAMRDSGTFDPLLDFITCPGDAAGPNNCVMDSQFANAVRLGDTQPLTVAEAIEKGMLHEDWPMYASTHREKDADNFCYTSGYCESNLRKLRASRVIPVGWEMAAAKSRPNAPVTLGEVVKGFDDCNEDGAADAEHPWCHLIDPDWVLKAPPAQCRAMVFGPSLLSPDANTRAETCADVQTCLAQDDLGNCVGGWGYCTRERNVWRFQGDSCPAHYDSCRSLTPRLGGNTLDILANTIDFGVCNADTVGCAEHFLRPNAGVDATAEGAWNTGAERRYLNANAGSCAATALGCSGLVPLTAGRSLNLVRNGGFEELEDGDGDGTPDHARHWSPFGVAPETATEVAAGTPDVRGTYAASGVIALSLAQHQVNAAVSQMADNCALATACTNPGGCKCVINSARNYLDNYSCKVPNGRSSCLVTSRVIQGDIPLRKGATYTASAVFTSADADPGVDGYFRIQFFGADGAIKSLPSGALSTLSVPFAGSTSNAVGADGCTVESYGGGTVVFLDFARTKAAGQKGVKATCTFQYADSDADPNNDAVKMSIELGSDGDDDGTTPRARATYADNVMIEESAVAGAFHEGYGEAPAPEYMKVAPAFLGCTGETSDPAACSSYAGVCREDEVGCDRFTPTNGDPAIPAVATTSDFCPAQCAGYDTFKQEETMFDGEKFPNYFIPSTARQCTEAESGCSEFTNVTNEQKAYFSAIRSCQAPSDDANSVFYSWEGSDTSGFQLKVWNLKPTETAVQNTASSVAVSGGNAGFAPCTAFNGNTGACTSPANPVATATNGLCTRADIDAGNFDCREFYDALGNRHYRLFSKTIVLSANCAEFRITPSTAGCTGTPQQCADAKAADCARANGKWDGSLSQCTYMVEPTLSTQCTAEASGCRPYKGNAAGNERNALIEQFEAGLGGWTGGTLSSEAVIVGGHSIKIDAAGNLERSVDGRVAAGRSYSVSFWARGNGNVSASFGPGAGTSFGAARPLSADWRQYTFGPVSVKTAGWGADVDLRIVKGANGSMFVDNVILKEVQDNIFVVRDSWNTPLACNQTADGAPSPQEMLGCKAYGNTAQRTVTLRSFTNICRDKAVGCQAYSHTQNTVADPYAHTWNAVCRLTANRNGANAAGVCQQQSCACDYDTRHLAQVSASGLEQVLLGDVCRASFGASTCRFETDRMVEPSMVAANPDVAARAVDARVYLVPGGAARCAAADIGCSAAGMAQQAYERTCTLPDEANDGARENEVVNGACNADSCSCSVAGGTCSVGRGARVCGISYDAPQTTGYLAKAVKDDPAQYARTLCVAEAVRCEAYKSSEGSLYFKDPGKHTCEYRENVTVNGEERSGWFRTSEAGGAVPCYDQLLQEGEFHNIAKNDDPEFDGADGGWAGLCTPQFDRCEQFVDPAQTSAANPEGKPYFYVVNAKLDMRSCAGQASLLEGCVLFNRVNDTSKRFTAFATYEKSDRSAAGNLVAPVDCNVNPRAAECENRCYGIENGLCLTADGGGSRRSCTRTAGQCGAFETCRGTSYWAGGCGMDADCNVGKGEVCMNGTGGIHNQSFYGIGPDGAYGRDKPALNDSNVVIKVRRDRECAEWLQCNSSQAAWDPATGKWKSVCTSVDACVAQRKVGDTQECGEWADTAPIRLDDEWYSRRDVTFRGDEYAGYSLANRYPASLVTLATSGDAPDQRRFGVIPEPTRTCDDDGDCPNRGTCLGRQCYYAMDGGPLGQSADALGQCRGYPEADAPFNGSVLASRGSGAEATLLKPGFKSANVCENGFNCDCSYERTGYGSNGAMVKFFGALEEGACTEEEIADGTCTFRRPNGICSGGPNEGEECSLGDDACVREEGGQCMLKTRVTRVVGWQGLCLDPDYSYNVAGDADRYACNLWWPVDQIPGSDDLNEQVPEAGFQSEESIAYCATAEGLAGDGTLYRETLLDQPANTRDFYLPGEDGGPRGFWEVNDDQQQSRIYPEPNFGEQPLPEIYKYQLADIQLYTDLGTNDRRLRPADQRATLSLTRSNSWTVMAATDEKGDTPRGEVVDNANVNCKWGTVSDNNEGNFICARAIWSDASETARLVRFETFTSNDQDDDGGNCGGVPPVNLCFNGLVTIFARYREACLDVAVVNDTVLASRHGGVNAVAWTDRLGRADSFGPVSRAHQSGRQPTGAASADMSPYGAIKHVFDLTSSTLSFRVSGAVASDWPIPVFASEGGSPLTTTRAETDPEDSNARRWNATTGRTASGIPYSCVGNCGATGDGAFDYPPQWENLVERRIARNVAIQNLGQLFAVGWGIYGWNPATNEFRSNIADDHGETTWDERDTWASAETAPQVRAVNTSACTTGVGCPEAGLGMTINGIPSGQITGVGRLRVSINYYAAADKDHMPIRRKYVDFGDGSAPIYSKVQAKNHRGCVVDQATGACSDVSQCAGFNADGSENGEWGRTAQTCDPSYYTVSKVYSCSAALHAQLPACAPSQGYPCRAGNACVYQPRIRIVDNWGQCNGFCPGGAAGSVCMNAVPWQFDDETQECAGKYVSTDPETWRSWTPYAGEIHVRVR